MLLIGLFTWATLVIELALAALWWARRLRPVLIGLLSFTDADWLERRIAARRATPQPA